MQSMNTLMDLITPMDMRRQHLQGTVELLVKQHSISTETIQLELFLSTDSILPAQLIPS